MKTNSPKSTIYSLIHCIKHFISLLAEQLVFLKGYFKLSVEQSGLGSHKVWALGSKLWDKIRKIFINSAGLGSRRWREQEQRKHKSLTVKLIVLLSENMLLSTHCCISMCFVLTLYVAGIMEKNFKSGPVSTFFLT